MRKTRAGLKSLINRGGLKQKKGGGRGERKKKEKKESILLKAISI